jgi:hypothetical protein
MATSGEKPWPPAGKKDGRRSRETGVRQVETKRQQFDEVVSARLGETWQWLIASSQPAEDPTVPVRWQETRLT